MIAALIVAAGRGLRAQSFSIYPKQYAKIAGESILARTLRIFLDHAMIDLVQVIIHPDDLELYNASLPDDQNNLCPPLYGGATRQESTLLGLEGLQLAKPDIVLIHDAARPLVKSHTISAVITALDYADGAIVAQPLMDTLKRAHPSSCKIASTIDRTNLWRAQTPQAFEFTKILSAHRHASNVDNINFPDDASVAEFAGLHVILVENNEVNFKITTAEDFSLAERYLNSPIPKIRVGQGYDVHKFETGDHVWLCGVQIPHDKSLKGHSDADVAMHALADAIYGALGDGDIGYHFPPSDKRWWRATSDIFLRHAVKRLVKRGGHLINVDVTIICETPKINAYRDTMRTKIASTLEIEISRVAIKATTTETLGFTGRREGIAALALATAAVP
ncbi:MAG: bifunctional 2-C-methyl-D-erythritol 4-phosphate cytidylyltransferase/2-C-methyl-D-erythritol 2,4-cyclodiphosphate synthase [Hyphomicrobiaceae bacterium]|nr:bifunctional 2-C-methyl-D-erythritol 4-phosphate cytidylyltransferase/2-C-methyl-D-erythritol 2,4-cyclodiphosphate synthase [Hyphomicrobiaceae bacterium]